MITLLDNVNTAIAGLFVIAIFAEQLTQVLKKIILTVIKKYWKKDSTYELIPEVKIFLALVVSCAICYFGKIKFYNSLDIPIWLNYLIAGVVCSGGSKGLHTLISWIVDTKKSMQDVSIETVLPEVNSTLLDDKEE